MSDYEISAWERDNDISGLPAWERRGMIARHDRHQSVWALVAKAAAWSAFEADK